MEQIQELITRVINGDTQAFEEIYQATYRQVYYTAFSFLKNEQNTLDVMQDTYITALTHLQQLENPERIVAWLNRIAVNKCKDFLMKKIPEPVEENSIDTELLEENDNFLPESYVLNAEKRKIILTIMQEELTAIQYQTILLYYFDGMSVPEIAACMECPEGTVKYRLSAARGKIKQGVQDYENTSGIKLYSSGSVALLTAIFVAESQSLVIPNVLANIFAGAAGLAGTAAGVAGAVASTSTASAIGGSAAGAATGTATGTGTAVAGAKAAGVAGKAGIKGLFQTLKAKVIAGVTAAALVAGGVTAGILTHNKKPDTGNHYRPVEITVCDDEYITLTIKRVYEQGYVPSEEEMPMYQLDPEAWTGEDCLIYYTVTNKTDKLVYYDLQIRSVNDECMDYDWEATNWWYLDPGRENMEICANNCNGIMPYKAGRDPMTRAKIELAVYTEGELAEPILQDHSVQEIDFTEDKETQAKAYTRTPAETDQVLVDNDELRITYIGAEVHNAPERSSFNAYPIFYVENKTDHDLLVTMNGTYAHYTGQFALFAGCSGYMTRTNINDWDISDSDDTGAEYQEFAQMYQDKASFDVTFEVYDYTASGIDYIAGDMYSAKTGHTANLQDALAASKKEYPASFVPVDYSTQQ